MTRAGAAAFGQSLALIALAPLLAGLIKRLKATLQNRRGPDLIQPYRDLWKAMRKETVVSETASWVTLAVPYVVFGGTAAAAFLVPAALADTPLGPAGDAIALVYLLAVPRFFLALGGLDAGSAFGGMGSSREMMISSSAEPALMLALFAAALEAGTTNLGAMARRMAELGWAGFNPGLALAAAALFLVALAECGRLPVDNPATHLELTMVHEAMILEQSGRGLGLIEWAGMLKLAIFLTLLADLFLPWGAALGADWTQLGLGAALCVLKLCALAVAVALVETATAKLRLFRVPDFLGTAFVLALLALLSQGVVRIGL
ncbi:MAG: NADH-quinone oxidoreductase subunit H [Elusimicrobia bacterium]|nr:NADH-quinone oxidoreductase subunit H [Elusimicrobiota bacterium]